MERSLAALRTEADAADIRLALLEQYMQLFELYRRQEVFSRNIEESERRLHDIRRMKEEGLITNNDVLQMCIRDRPTPGQRLVRKFRRLIAR